MNKDMAVLKLQEADLTFESFIRAGRRIFVGVELQGQLFVGALDIILTAVLLDSKDLIERLFP